MYIVDEETGDMTIRQGDTYTFRVEGVSDDYELYYSVYNANRDIVWEISTTPVDGVADFTVTPYYSNQLTVPKNKRTAIYYYGLKRCKDGYEDTLIVGDKSINELNKITVYPLITEGTENAGE